jgi:hypothetical protein
MPIKRSKQLQLRLDPRVVAALARGKRLRRKMAEAEGGAMTCRETARLLGITESAVLKNWKGHGLIGWVRGKNVFFPRWQFIGGRLLPGIEEILQTFASDDHWRLMAYFLCTRHSLNNRRPLDLIRSGELSAIIDHAKAYAREDLW